MYIHIHYTIHYILYILYWADTVHQPLFSYEHTDMAISGRPNLAMCCRGRDPLWIWNYCNFYLNRLAVQSKKPYVLICVLFCVSSAELRPLCPSTSKWDRGSSYHLTTHNIEHIARNTFFFLLEMFIFCTLWEIYSLLLTWTIIHNEFWVDLE